MEPRRHIFLQEGRSHRHRHLPRQRHTARPIRPRRPRQAGTPRCRHRRPEPQNGYGTVKTAIQLTDNSWRMKHEHESKRYTTNLDDVIKVR